MAILTVTLNPALDLSSETDAVIAGPKLRCASPRFDPGGGGVNVSRAIARLGGTSLPFIATGGATGEMYMTLLNEEGVAARWFETPGLTRQSIMIYESSSGDQFRFVMPGPEWDAQSCDGALSALESTLREASDPFHYIVASGSLPRGVPDDFYHRIAQSAEAAGARLVLDTSGNALRAAASGRNHPPHIWVMDQREAEEVGGRRIGGMGDLEALAIELCNRKLAEIVILSLGEGGAVAVSREETHRIFPPAVEVLSKVGAGDSFVGGLVLKLDEGASLYEACAFAVAAAASAVTTPATQLCDGPQARQYFEAIISGKT